MNIKLSPSALHVAPDVTLYHVGPPLDLGPLPSFFYFALSAPDSLCQDPYNQIVQFLHGQMIRVFSMTLPGHENNLPPTQALKTWADDYTQNLNPIDDFLQNLWTATEFAIQNKFANPEKLAIGGLSRGGFIALHAAARDPRFRFVLPFAPITEIDKLHEFTSIQDAPAIRSLNVMHLKQNLWDRSIRFHIGNHDTLVDTKACFHFVMNLVEEAAHHNLRSPQIELFLHPSMGHKGHGTPMDVFKKGADWISSCLLH